MTDQTRPLNPAAVVPQRLAVDLVEEIDQQRTRAEAAEAEREQAHNALIATRQMANDANAALRGRLLAALGIENDGHTSLTGYVDALTGQLARLHEQLADAHAAAARSATEAANLREHLDRANTERQTLAQELADAAAAESPVPSRRAQADALRWAADRIDPGPAATRRKATDVHDLGVLNANRGTASNLRLWASSVERGVINVSESDQAGPSAPPRADLPTYGDDAPGTLRSRP